MTNSPTHRTNHLKLEISNKEEVEDNNQVVTTYRCVVWFYRDTRKLAGFAVTLVNSKAFFRSASLLSSAIIRVGEEKVPWLYEKVEELARLWSLRGIGSFADVSRTFHEKTPWCGKVDFLVKNQLKWLYLCGVLKIFDYFRNSLANLQWFSWILYNISKGEYNFFHYNPTVYKSIENH